jgi:DNA-directed RNA polymerase specialized sigma24 family protein
MSPLPVRRYRAEKLLRREFEGLRAQVLAVVGSRLRALGIEPDHCELEASYALAWQGLYAAVLEGEEIQDPRAWLVLVTFRRAVEERRARRAAAGHAAALPAAQESDLADEIDDRVRLEQLFEGLSRLSERERRAATLCLLQGLSRAEAAQAMGISQGRMRKLMEGPGAGGEGVSGKIGALARTIEEGGWCDSQGSLMRALAYGILDRDGERYRLALGHHRRCPSCRSYVRALRGLAAGMPPVLLPAARLVLAGGPSAADGLRGALARLAGRAGSGARAGAVPGAARASGAGGGLALAGGPLGAKLAVGCLVAIGVGAGCIGLETSRAPNPRPGASHPARAQTAAVRHRPSTVGRLSASVVISPSPSAGAPAARPATATTAAALEFGPEQAPAGGPASPLALHPQARAARAPSRLLRAAARIAAVTSAPATRAATREFSP